MRVQDKDIVAVAIMSTVDPACEKWTTKARLDTPSAREFLGQFVELP